MNSKAKQQQQELLDDDTFNFLVELRAVSLGTYDTLISFALTDSRRTRDWIKQAQRFWAPWLGGFRPNVFVIVSAARSGIL